MRLLGSSTTNRISLMIGSFAFGLFWGRELVDLKIPWIIALAVHGISVVGREEWTGSKDTVGVEVVLLSSG